MSIMGSGINMSKYKFSMIQRTAIWKAYKNRCFYSEEYLPFSDMEIDHIIPEWLEDIPEEFDKLKKRLDLSEEFQINSYYNWVPVKHRLNRRKGALKFSDSNFRYYLELVRSKVNTVISEIKKLENQANNEKILTSLAAQIDSNHITKAEIITFLNGVDTISKNISDPIVITFSTLIENLSVDENEIIKQFNILEEKFRQNTNAIIVISEQENNGETLSMRLAFWYFDINEITSITPAPWIITEIAMYSEIYEDNPEELYKKAVVQIYQKIIYDPNDPVFRLSMCPDCGSKQLERSSSIDYNHDEEYFLIKCLDCGWGDWTQ